MSVPSNPTHTTLPSPETGDQPPTSDRYVGMLVGRKYRIMKVLGEGAMGIVLEGRHIELDQRVAIKFLRREMMTRDDMVQRFDREAKTVARLHSEHIARVLDVGNEEGVPYFVMEYLRGSSVAQLLAHTPQLPIEVAASYAIEACAGLAEAHAAGVIHRDIKPENLFLVVMPDGSRKLKVLDFGVSKTALTGSPFDNTGTQTDTMVGSPLYMSPEQVRAQVVDARSDIWSLGAALFEMIAGRPPFEASTLPQVCAMVLEAPVPDVRTFRPDCPESLALAIGRCLTRDPAQRFPNAGELAMELVVHASARAALVADTAVALSRRTSSHGSEPPPPPDDLGREHSNSLLEVHLAARSYSGTHPNLSRSSLNVAATSHPPAMPAPRSKALPVLAALGVAGVAVALFLLRPSSAPPSPAHAVASVVATTSAEPPAASTAAAAPLPAVPASAPVASAAPVETTTASAPAASALHRPRPLGGPRPPVALPSTHSPTVDPEIRRTR